MVLVGPRRSLVLALTLSILVPPAQAFPQATLPTQGVGDRGVDVEAVQYLLAQHGYEESGGLLGGLLGGLFGPPTPDGVFDATVDDLVRDFQADRGLAADGIVGPNTWGALLVTLRQGDGGSTEADAVRALQRLLNEKRGAGLAVDGDFDATTDAAVRDFQAHAGIGQDGVVGPTTWRNLLWHYEQLDTSQAAVCGYRTAAYRWGTASTIAWLEAAADSVDGSHGPVAFGDLGAEHGGDIPGHASHEVGLDVDIRPMRTDQDQCNAGCRHDLSCYDRAATRDLVEAIRDLAPGHVKHVWFNDPVLIDEGLTEPLENHSDHLHVRFCEATHADARYAC